MGTGIPGNHVATVEASLDVCGTASRRASRSFASHAFDRVRQSTRRRADFVGAVRRHACLNESDTVAACVAKAVETLEKMGITYEVIVADNGSTDNSRELAEQHGARVVNVLTVVTEPL